jgi:hypothetical protein
VAVDNVIRGPRYSLVGGSLLASRTNYALARAYCGMSLAWKLFKDLVLRLALLLLCHQALLVYKVLWDIYPHA